jgi:hypothetical protein
LVSLHFLPSLTLFLGFSSDFLVSVRLMTSRLSASELRIRYLHGDQIAHVRKIKFAARHCDLCASCVRSRRPILSKFATGHFDPAPPAKSIGSSKVSSFVPLEPTGRFRTAPRAAVGAAVLSGEITPADQARELTAKLVSEGAAQQDAIGLIAISTFQGRS